MTYVHSNGFLVVVVLKLHHEWVRRPAIALEKMQLKAETVCSATIFDDTCMHLFSKEILPYREKKPGILESV